MRQRFLIHKLAETYLLVDISEAGATVQSVPFLQFGSWKALEDYLLNLGATKEALDKAKAEADKNGTTHLLI